MHSRFLLPVCSVFSGSFSLIELKRALVLMSRSSALPSVFVWILLVVRDFSACELDRCWGGHHPWCDTFVRSINLEWGSACSVGSNRPFALGSKHRCCLSLRSAASVNHCQARGHFICFMRSFLHIAGFVSVNHVHPKQQFDATKGYPGKVLRRSTCGPFTLLILVPSRPLHVGRLGSQPSPACKKLE